MTYKRIITDQPGMVGYRDGINTDLTKSRTSRVRQLPEDQQGEYLDNFKRGVRYQIQIDNELEEE